MENKLFAVVCFKADGSSDYVPTNSLVKNDNRVSVRFPRFKTSQTVKLQQNSSSDPNPVWPEWEVDVIKSYDSAKKAEQKVDKFSNYGDSNGAEPERKRRRPEPTLETVEEPRISLHILPTLSPTPFSITSKPDHERGLTYNESIPRTVAVNVPAQDNSVSPYQESSFAFSPIHYDNLTLNQMLHEQREFQAKSLTNQETLIREQQETKALLLNVLSKLTTQRNDNPGSRSGIFGVIPMRNEENLILLNQYLEDRSSFGEMVCALEVFGRTEVKQTTYDILNYLFDVLFSKTVRYPSNSGKIPFGGRKLEAAIKDAVKSNHPSAKEKQITKRIAAWFRNSSDRGGGRKNRNGNSKTKPQEKSTEGCSEISAGHSNAGTTSITNEEGTL